MNDKKHFSHLNAAIDALKQFDNGIPLANWLKKFFATRKQMGSTDRKRVSSLVYAYYRLGRKTKDLELEEAVVKAAFVVGYPFDGFFFTTRPELDNYISKPLNERMDLAFGKVEDKDIFPLTEFISERIDKNAFIRSHLLQSKVFIRTRPDKHYAVTQKLMQHKVAFQEIEKDCLAVEKDKQLDNIIALDKEAVIQDWASQQTGRMLKKIGIADTPMDVWDCCAASGGKSIMAQDILGEINLVVSDIRESILMNLRARFKRADIIKPEVFLMDLGNPINHKAFKKKKFHLVICDAPCTGSGTWNRTPENLTHFMDGELERFVALQQTILGNIASCILDGGYLLYITCSVFQKENEENIRQFLASNSLFISVEESYFEGHEKRACTMYAALLKKDKC